MSTVEAIACVDCGTTIERELPEGALREFMLRIARCGSCTEKVAEDARQEEEQRAERAAVALQERRLAASELPAGLRGLTFDGLDPRGIERVVAAAKAWATSGGGLLLTGPVGVGKTTVAATACRAALEHRFCQWISAPLLFARLGSGLGSQQRDAALEVLTSVAALVLDDLDKARPTEYGAEHVFLAIDGRITNGSPLLVTTNLSLSELAAKFPEPYGEAIASRLAGYCQTVTLAGKDRRLA